MKPVTRLAAGDVDYWRANSAVPPQVRIFTAADDPRDCTPCPGIVTVDHDGRPVVRVKWQPEPAEVGSLLDGGCIWLSTWGGLPAHAIEVGSAPGVPRPSVLPEQVGDLFGGVAVLETAGGRCYLARGHWPAWLAEAAVMTRVATDEGVGRAEGIRENGLVVSYVWVVVSEPTPGEVAGMVAWDPSERAGGDPATLVQLA